jgi:hypothetical protein
MHFWSYLVQFFSEWKTWDKCCCQNQNKHFMFNVFFRKLCPLWDNVEKYCTAGQVTDDNMAHAHCMLYAYGYKHTLRICNTHCFSTAKILARMPLNITLYVHCVSCLTYCLPVCAVLKSIIASVFFVPAPLPTSSTKVWLVQHRQFSVNGASSE